MTDTEILARLTDLEVLAGTMYAEAAGDFAQGNSSVEERIAVGCVCRNRTTHPPLYMAKDAWYRSICLAPLQFSCWIAGSGANYTRLMAQMGALIEGQPVDPVLKETLLLADGVINRSILDRTGGATFYYAPRSMVPPGSKPGWARGRDGHPDPEPVATIGSQLFYKL